MRVLSICLLVAVLFSACSKDAKQKIRDVFMPEYTAPKPVTAKHYHTGAGPCGADLYINSDATFTYETGCEGHTSTAVGKYQIAGDSIKMLPLDKGPDNIAYKVNFSQSVNDPKVTFIVSDKTGEPVNKFTIQPPSKNSFNIGNAYGTDSTGTLRINKSIADSLDFPKLFGLTGKKFTISTHGLPDTVKLQIDINGGVLSAYDVKYVEKVMQIKLKYTNGEVVFR